MRRWLHWPPPSLRAVLAPILAVAAWLLTFFPLPAQPLRYLPAAIATICAALLLSREWEAATGRLVPARDLTLALRIEPTSQQAYLSPVVNVPHGLSLGLLVTNIDLAGVETITARLSLFEAFTDGKWQTVNHLQVLLPWEPGSSTTASLAAGGRAFLAVVKQYWNAGGMLMFADGPHGLIGDGRWRVTIEFHADPARFRALRLIHAFEWIGGKDVSFQPKTLRWLSDEEVTAIERGEARPRQSERAPAS